MFPWWGRHELRTVLVGTEVPWLGSCKPGGWAGVLGLESGKKPGTNSQWAGHVGRLELHSVWGWKPWVLPGEPLRSSLAFLKPSPWQPPPPRESVGPSHPTLATPPECQTATVYCSWAQHDTCDNYSFPCGFSVLHQPVPGSSPSRGPLRGTVLQDPTPTLTAYHVGLTQVSCQQR